MTDEFTNWLIITYDQIDEKFLRVHTYGGASATCPGYWLMVQHGRKMRRRRRGRWG